MIIIVSGLPGSGKSSLVELLSQEFKLKKIFASGILEELGRKKMQEIHVENAEKGQGFWESKEGKQLMNKRTNDTSLDKTLDEKLLEIANTQDNVILDSRTMPWLSPKGIKIWVDASETVRAQRIAERDKLKTSEVLKQMQERLKTDQQIYKKLYGFDLGKDFSPFHIVINNETIGKKETAELVIKKIKQFQKKTK
ncbi:MAG: cytidylate kinase family protein [Candidatus Diapherotrites archaeon]|nr:cytidylate kinase family protein [Candidatus Diapherotrites archaeon]